MEIMLILLRVVHLLTLIAFASSDYYTEESPSKFPSKTTKSNTKSKWRTTQAHVSTAKCPRGTVPLQQDEASEYLGNNTSTHKYAEVSTDVPPKLYGTKGTINVWDPKVENKDIELSISQIWISSGVYDENNLNTIEVGWQVYPQLYTDNRPRLFIFWTSDAYQTTGCYNLRCPGFVQTSRNIVLGGAISPVSVFGDRQYEITVHVWKDHKQGNWWLSLGPENLIVGYWPGELFTNLEYAENVHWGGEIVDSRSFGRATKTEMGSGHFPAAGFGKASYFRNLEIVCSNNNFQPVQSIKTNVDSKYYDVNNLDTDDEWGVHFFYGGPGFSHTHSGVVPRKLRLSFICFCFSLFFII